MEKNNWLKLSIVIFFLFVCFAIDRVGATGVDSRIRYECNEDDEGSCGGRGTNGEVGVYCDNYPCILGDFGWDTDGCVAYSAHTSKPEYNNGENVNIYYYLDGSQSCQNSSEASTDLFIDNQGPVGTVGNWDGWRTSWGWYTPHTANFYGQNPYYIPIGFKTCSGRTWMRNVATITYRTVIPNDYQPQISDRSPINGDVKCPNLGQVPFRLGVAASDPDGPTNLRTDIYWEGGGGHGVDQHMSEAYHTSWYWTYDQNFGPARYIWRANVFDGVHNTQTDWWSFTVNSAPTGINQNSPYSGQRFDSSGGNYWVNFGLSATDPDNNVNHMAVYVRNTNTGQQYIPACEVWSANGSCGMSLPPGNYGWSACAWDTPCNAAFCNWSWRPFQVNEIPTVTAQAPGSGCGQVNLSAIAQHNFVSGEQAWIRFDYWGGKNGSITYPISSSFQSFPLTLTGISGNSTINWSVRAWDSNGTSSPTVSGQSVTPNCTPNPPYGFNQTINCSQATLSASGSDPDGGQLSMIFTVNSPWMTNQPPNIRSGEQASTTFNLGFDRAFSWMVSARDPYGAQRDSGWMGTYLTDRSPTNKYSNQIIYQSTPFVSPSSVINISGSTYLEKISNLNLNNNPKFVIDDNGIKSRTIQVNDFSTDLDGAGQDVRMTLNLDAFNSTPTSWGWSSSYFSRTGIQASGYNSNVYTHFGDTNPYNTTIPPLYAGAYRYRLRDNDSCGAISNEATYYFRIVPPVVKNIKDTTGDSGCPTCGVRRTKINIDWDDVPYIQTSQTSGVNSYYYVQWSNDDGATWKEVTKPSSLDPSLGNGYVVGSAITLETDVLDLYNLSTSTPRNIRYRVASISNGIFSDWVVYPPIGQPAITYNCPIPGGLTISPNPIDMRGDEDSPTVTAKIHCRDFNGAVVGVLGGDMIGAAQANRIYPPDTMAVSFVWNQTDIDNLNTCSTGTKINTPPTPGNTIHAGSNTTVDPCEGKLGATLTNYGWPEIGSLTGDTWVAINPRATEEFNYSGEVISNPPPGFEKLDLPNVQK